MVVHGHLTSGLFDLRLVVQRHADIVQEMRRRKMLSGIIHDTPLEHLPPYNGPGAPGWLSLTANEALLRVRCDNCRY